MFIKSKKMIIATFFLVSNAGFSGTMDAEVPDYLDAKEGLYLGAGVGGSFNNYKLTATNLATGVDVNSKVNNRAVIGDVFIGYGYTTVNSFYLGGEVGTNFPRRSATINSRPGVVVTSTTFTDTLQIRDYVTLDLLPGYRVMPYWLLYGRAGIIFGQLKLDQPANSAAGVPSFTASNNSVGGAFWCRRNLRI